MIKQPTSTKETLNAMYKQAHDLDREIVAYEKQMQLVEEAKKKSLVEISVQRRLDFQHKDDMTLVAVWCVLSGILGIGLGLLLAWIF